VSALSSLMEPMIMVILGVLIGGTGGGDVSAVRPFLADGAPSRFTDLPADCAARSVFFCAIQ
jgi:hypothetical protein